MRNREGFTLIELMIVTVLIGMLATIVVSTFKGYREKAKLAATRTELRNVMTAAEIFRTVEGVFPETVQDLVDGGYHRESGRIDFCVFERQAGPPEDLHMEAAYQGLNTHLVARYPSWGVVMEETTAATDCS